MGQSSVCQNCPRWPAESREEPQRPKAGCWNQDTRFCPPHPQIATRQERRPQNPGKAGIQIQTRAACSTRGSPAWVAPEKHQLSLGAPAGGLEAQRGPGISPTCPPLRGRFCTRARAEYWGDCWTGSRGSEGGPSPAPCRGSGTTVRGGFPPWKDTPEAAQRGWAGPETSRPWHGRCKPGTPALASVSPSAKSGCTAGQARPRGCTFPARPLSPGSLQPQFPRPVPPRPGLTMAPRDIGRLALSPPPPRVLGRNGVAAARANQRQAAGGDRPIPAEEGGTREEGGLTACRKASHGLP